MAGRPTKFTPEREKTILDALKNGMTRSAAAGLAGVHVVRLCEWCAKYSNFRNACAVAEQEAEARITGTLIKAVVAGDWKAAESWLKRRRRDEWGDGVSVRYERMTEDELRAYITGLPLGVAPPGLDSPGDRQGSRAAAAVHDDE